MGDVRRRGQWIVLLALTPVRRCRPGGAVPRVGAGLLAVSILAGCAQGGASEHRPDAAAAPTVAASSATPASHAAQARGAVTAASAVLARQFRAAGLVLAPVTAGTFVRCRPGSARALYSADL